MCPPAPAQPGHRVLKSPGVAWGQMSLDHLGESSLATRDLRAAAGNQGIGRSLEGARSCERGGKWLQETLGDLGFLSVLDTFNETPPHVLFVLICWGTYHIEAIRSVFCS